MSLLTKLYTDSREAAYHEILARYAKQGYAVVSFLYFANLMHARLLEEPTEQWQQDYGAALEQADFLLPDGIALQLFYRWGPIGRSSGTMPHNLNGTDFIPYFLDRLLRETDDVHLGVLTVYDPLIGKPAMHLDEAAAAFDEQFAHPIDWSDQLLYRDRETKEFDLAGYLTSLKETDAKYNILLLCTGSPAQEIRVERHRDQLEQAGVIVFNAGGLLDYISGFEQRAPQRVVQSRVLETPRRILQHPKKNLKKLGWMFGILRYWRKNLFG